ncbi:MAG: nitroreductase/quinone reductase family protein [Acidimicrobiales bacterium]
MTPDERRHLTIRFVERHITNPPWKALLRLGVAPRAFALVETTGRRSGQRRRTPVGGRFEGQTFWIVAAGGERSAYVLNLLAQPRVRVKVGRRWRSGTAEVVPDDDGLARRRWIDAGNGLVGRFDGVLFRATARQALTIRIDLDPEGTKAPRRLRPGPVPRI